MDSEKRNGQQAEIRADDDALKVSGYAAVFNESADIGGVFIERIMPGAFSAVLENDVIFNIDHEGLPLARTRSGTLKLEQDERGLRMETELDANDPDVKRIVGKMKRGDLDKMSFAFRVGKQEWDDTQEPPVRTITEISDLYDVSIVTTPAYEGTEIGLRSLTAFRKEKNKGNALRRIRMKRSHPDYREGKATA